MRFSYSLALFAAIVSTGCTTVVVDRAQNVAAAGKTYIETLRKVNALALDKSISLSAVVLANNNFENGTRNMSMFDDTTTIIQERVVLVGDANDYFNTISLYFEELSALSKDNQSDATAAAIGRLADELKKEPVKLKLSDAKRSGLTGFAGYITKQVHAASVEKALKRDADRVAQSLALTEEMLDEQVRWINVDEKSTRQKNYLLKVRTPYAGQAAALDDKWKEAWSDHVKTSPVIELLNQARKSSMDMQQAWKNALRGDYSFDEIKSSIQEVRTGIEVVTAIKNAK